MTALFESFPILFATANKMETSSGRVVVSERDFQALEDVFNNARLAAAENFLTDLSEAERECVAFPSYEDDAAMPYGDATTNEAADILDHLYPK